MVLAHVCVCVSVCVCRTPLSVPISKRDSLLEKERMFRDVAGALSRHPSQDNGLDGPYTSGTGKLEQVRNTPEEIPYTHTHTLTC